MVQQLSNEKERTACHLGLHIVTSAELLLVLCCVVLFSGHTALAARVLRASLFIC